MRRGQAIVEPENGSLVRLFEGTYHANPIEDQMLDGDFATHKMFQEAAERLDIYKGIAGLSFTIIYKYMLKKTEVDEGVSRKYDLYGQYINWSNDASQHRSHILIARPAIQLVADTLQGQITRNQNMFKRDQVIQDVLEHLELVSEV
jgi:hypothetical protein